MIETADALIALETAGTISSPHIRRLPVAGLCCSLEAA